MDYDVYWVDDSGVVHLDVEYDAPDRQDASQSVFNKRSGTGVGFRRIVRVDPTDWNA